MMFGFTPKCPIFAAALLIWVSSFGNCGVYYQPTVTITSAFSDTICTAGTSSTFTASISNGGTSPVYQWLVNGIGVGADTDTYTGVLNNNDLVYCRLTSNLACATPGVVTSNEIRVTVDEGSGITLTPSIDCTGNPLIVTGASTASTIIWHHNSSVLDTTLGQNAYNSIVRAGNGDTGSALSTLRPYGIWVDSVGDIYAADAANSRILRFNKGSIAGNNGVIVAGGNGDGSAANQLSNPQGVFVDKQGNLLVADYGNQRIQKFGPGSTQASNATTLVGGFEFSGTNLNDLLGPVDVQEDDSGNIYVWDQSQGRVLQYPGTIRAGQNGAYTGPTLVGNTCEINGMWVLGNGAMYISNTFNKAVEYYVPLYQMATANVTHYIVAGGSGYGNRANQLNNPAGLYVDGYGNLFIADNGNQRVQMYPPNSNVNTNGVTVAYNEPVQNIWLDGGNNIYFSETYKGIVRELINGIGTDTILIPQQPGTYSAVIQTAGNCRTLSTGTVTVKSSPGDTINVTICDGRSYQVGTNLYSNTGTYYYSLNNPGPNGCDTLVTLNLAVDYNDQNTPQITQAGNTLTASTLVGDDTTYLWMVNGIGFLGDNGTTITAPMNGQYQATGVDTNGCFTNSATYTAYNIEGITQINNDYGLSVQPNPANLQLTLHSQQAIGQQYSVYNVLGQQIIVGNIVANNQQIGLSNLTTGIYLLQVKGTALRFAIER